eukprot:9390345-Prorocentrum_lima.AAC.1
MGRIIQRASPTYGSPLTDQVFTSLSGIDRRTDICRVSPMAYQERVGPLSFMQARAVYGDKPLTMLKPKSYLR